MLVGGFNCVLRGEERSSGQGVSSSFVDWVQQRDLIDIRFFGLAFTWHHGSNLAT